MLPPLPKVLLLFLFFFFFFFRRFFLRGSAAVRPGSGSVCTCTCTIGLLALRPPAPACPHALTLAPTAAAAMVIFQSPVKAGKLADWHAANRTRPRWAPPPLWNIT